MGYKLKLNYSEEEPWNATEKVTIVLTQDNINVRSTIDKDSLALYLKDLIIALGFNLLEEDQEKKSQDLMKKSL